MDFRVFTLNCWGIPFVSKNRKERMQAVATALVNSTYDVVCLQEVWSDADFFLIRDKLIGNFPYSHYFYSGVIGSGVCIFSKHQIVEAHFHKWMINGYVHKIHHGDWWGGKGVGLCKIKFHKMFINVYTTHLHAEYNRKFDEYYACRIVQAFETAQFIKLTACNADLIVLAGDLNTEPGDLAFRLLTSLPNLVDACKESLSEEKELSTNLAWRNSYTPEKLKRDQIPGVRIDYILYKSGSGVVVNLKGYQQPFPDFVPECSFSYSDHEAIAATLVLQEQGEKLSSVNISDQKSALKESIEVLDKGIQNLANNKLYFAIATVILFVVIVISLIFPLPVEALFHVIRIILTFVMCYTFIMASLWNLMEHNSLYACKLAMEVNLNGLD